MAARHSVQAEALSDLQKLRRLTKVVTMPTIDELCLADGGRVFPFAYETRRFAVNSDGRTSQDGPATQSVTPGMTYRQWLIGQAMSGDFAGGFSHFRGPVIIPRHLDDLCGLYEAFADRIIARMEERYKRDHETPA